MTTEEAVRAAVEQRPGMRFAGLVDAVRVVAPWAGPCEVDAAARPYEHGEPGAFTYEVAP